VGRQREDCVFSRIEEKKRRLFLNETWKKKYLVRQLEKRRGGSNHVEVQRLVLEGATDRPPETENRAPEEKKQWGRKVKRQKKSLAGKEGVATA